MAISDYPVSSFTADTEESTTPYNMGTLPVVTPSMDNTSLINYVKDCKIVELNERLLQAFKEMTAATQKMLK